MPAYPVRSSARSCLQLEPHGLAELTGHRAPAGRKMLDQEQPAPTLGVVAGAPHAYGDTWRAVMHRNAHPVGADPGHRQSQTGARMTYRVGDELAGEQRRGVDQRGELPVIEQ